MSIREAKPEDLKAIAILHKQQFGDHFLGQYSPGLLARYYRQFLGSSAFLVHESNGIIDGFVLGGNAERMNDCRANFVRGSLFRCIYESLLRPRIWSRAMRSGWDMLRSSRNSVPGKRRSYLNDRLLSIAVSPNAMGKGIASTLVHGFEDVLGNENVIEYGLSVKKANARAVHFYIKLGFAVENESEDTFFFRKQIESRNPRA